MNIVRVRGKRRRRRRRRRRVQGQAQGQAQGHVAVIDLASPQHNDAASSIDLFPLRLNWDRLSFALAGPAMLNFSQFPQVAALQRKMARVCGRSRYVDDYERVLTAVVEPYDLFWFQRTVKEAYSSALRDLGGSYDTPAKVSCFVSPCAFHQYLLLNS